jgi:hypothetical protein
MLRHRPPWAHRLRNTQSKCVYFYLDILCRRHSLRRRDGQSLELMTLLVSPLSPDIPPPPPRTPSISRVLFCPHHRQRYRRTSFRAVGRCFEMQSQRRGAADIDERCILKPNLSTAGRGGGAPRRSERNCRRPLHARIVSYRMQAFIYLEPLLPCPPERGPTSPLLTCMHVHAPPIRSTNLINTARRRINKTMRLVPESFPDPTLASPELSPSKRKKRRLHQGRGHPCATSAWAVYYPPDPPPPFDTM